MLLIDHDIGLVLDVCDHIYVLDFGQLIAEGDAATIRANPALAEAYLNQRRPDDAVAKASDVLKADSKVPAAYLIIAAAHLQKSQFDAAIAGSHSPRRSSMDPRLYWREPSSGRCRRASR